MKTIESPFENGQIQKSWIHKIFRPWRSYRKALEEQVTERGPVPNELWRTKKRKEIADKISSLINEYCWGIDLQFAPSDPWYVIGEFEVGDLSEVELIMAIEREFSIDLSDDLFGWGFTFENLVDFIEDKGQSGGRELTD